MAIILLVDDAVALAQLFAETVERELGHTVHTIASLADVGSALAALDTPDLALVDMSFPHEKGSGLDALVRVRQDSPGTKLAIITQGDEWVAQTLRDAWELLPITAVISKTAPLALQLSTITKVLRDGSAPPDPAIQTLLPKQRSGRRLSDFALLVQHAGHAKFWKALVALDNVTYKSLAQRSGLKLNTLKNYRAQLLPPLATHGLHDPSLREMSEFAHRCGPFLRPFVESALQEPRSP